MEALYINPAARMIVLYVRVIETVLSAEGVWGPVISDYLLAENL